MKRYGWFNILAVALAFFASGCAAMRDAGFRIEDSKTVCDYIQGKRVLVVVSSMSMGAYNMYFNQAITPISEKLKECRAVVVPPPAGYSAYQTTQTAAILKRNGVQLDMVMLFGMNDIYSPTTNYVNNRSHIEHIWRMYADVQLVGGDGAVIESGAGKEDFRWYDYTYYDKSQGLWESFWRTTRKVFLFGYYNLSMAEINRNKVEAMKDAVKDAVGGITSATLNEAFLPPKPQPSAEIKSRLR